MSDSDSRASPPRNGVPVNSQRALEPRALTPTCVGGYCHLTTTHVYVDGKPFAGDPRAILLTDHKEIAIVIGTPPKKIPAAADFSPA